MNVNFLGGQIPNRIPQKYTTEESKKNTVAVMGSSKTTDKLMNYLEVCSAVTKNLVKADKNIVHGCGNAGIMGCAYKAAQNNSKLNIDGKPEHNLAIVMEPRWGDEDLENCIAIASANSEADRIQKFMKVADNFVIFPGSAGTMQELTTLISNNTYGKPEQRKKIILVGKDFFSGIKEQYQKLYDAGLLKYPPEELFTIAQDEAEVLNYFKDSDGLLR